MSDPIPSVSGEPDYNSLSKEQLIELLQAMQSLVSSERGKKMLRNETKLASESKSESSLIQRRIATMPYYKERFAREIKLTVDEMLLDNKNRVYKYSDFKNLSKNTLYLRIHQSFLYLTDNSDDPKYLKARDSIEVKKMHNGIYLMFTESLGVASILTEETSTASIATEAPPKNREWKTKLEDFITNGAINSKLTIKDISLDDEEIEEAKMLMFGLDEQFMYKIASEYIMVIRFDPTNPPNL